MKISKKYLSHENKLATTNNMNADAINLKELYSYFANILRRKKD